MQVTKIYVLTICEACQGKAYLPAGEAISSKGVPYLVHKPCSQCGGSGRQAQWVSLDEFMKLLDEEITRNPIPVNE